MTALLQCSSILLVEYADSGMPEERHFSIKEETLDVSSVPAGGIVIQLNHISADPYLRGRVKSKGKHPLGTPLRGFVTGTVISSDHKAWKSGDLFGASMPFVTVQMLTASQLKETLMWKLTGIVDREQLSLGLGILGMPGSTAYGGLLDVLAAKKGETLWVSAAAGAVGSMVGQIAKNVVGMTVVGSCGGEQKGKIIREQFGFDHSVDYKTVSTAEELAAKVRDCVPEGIDCYFENVGGFILRLP